MSDRALSARGLLADLSKRQADLAESILNGKLSYEDYLVGVGKHRECRSLIQLLKSKIERATQLEDRVVDVDEEPGDDPEDEPEEESRAAPGRRYKPRGWGGG